MASFTAGPPAAFTPIDPAVLAELQNERQRKMVEFGWSASYGKLTSMEKGNQKRIEASEKADQWFFAEIGKLCTLGQEYLAMRTYFDQVDFPPHFSFLSAKFFCVCVCL